MRQTPWSRHTRRTIRKIAIVPPMISRMMSGQDTAGKNVQETRLRPAGYGRRAVLRCYIP